MAIKIENNLISLAVRDLIKKNSNTQKTLSSFPLPQRGMLGKQAQIKTQQHKNKSFGLFHSEYSVSGEFYFNGYNFAIYGRIDGIYEINNHIEVEEIKSVILTASDFKNLQIDKYPEFSEQVLFYSYLVHNEMKEQEIIPYVTLINLVNDKTRTFPINFSPPVVESILFKRFELIIDEINREKELTEKRKRQLSGIRFSLSENRPQQQKMMEAVQSCLTNEQNLLISAPTGTGKTAGSLFPALKFAFTNNKKIFFSTSKTTQQRVVEETIVPICEDGLDLKILFLRSADKMCLNDIFLCHEDYCPFAKNYQERLAETNLLEELLEVKILKPDIIFDKSKTQSLCPVEVMMDLTVYSDIIVGDYNYVFDPSASLRRIFQYKDYSDWILIVDEAHNLYQRGIDYFSPTLHLREVHDLISIYGKRKSRIFKILVNTLKELESILNSFHQEGEIHFSGKQYFEVQLDKHAWQRVFDDYEVSFIKYLIHNVKKNILIKDDPLEVFYYKLKRFVQVVKIQNESFISFYNAEANGILKIQCCDPSEHLGNRILGFHSVIGMSATLDPMLYYQKVLGFPVDNTKHLQLDSPFPTENRKLIIFPGFSTVYKKRFQNYPNYAEIIEKIINTKSGNYVAFFPSFEFLQNTNLFLGKVKCEKIIQKPGMKESERTSALQQLQDSGRPNLLLAVMGGIFSEGVDFIGDMCIGVIIFSPALPQINYERELIRRYYDLKSEDGFNYAYLYPGINKVIQAVGRLIRSYRDKGIVILVGERFAEERVNELFPEFWFQRPGDVVITHDYEKEIKDFWKTMDKN